MCSIPVDYYVNLCDNNNTSGHAWHTFYTLVSVRRTITGQGTIVGVRAGGLIGLVAPSVVEAIPELAGIVVARFSVDGESHSLAIVLQIQFRFRDRSTTFK